MKLKVPLGSGLTTCGCRSCGEVFTALRGFDLHQRGGRCLPPSEAGLRQRPDGKWSQPPRRTDDRSA